MLCWHFIGLCMGKIMFFHYIVLNCFQDTIEVKKDTERADAIRAQKLAWEEAEPGRAAKAKQSRLNYLSSHVIKVYLSSCYFKTLNCL